MANTRVQNATLITTNIPDNTSGAVTPEKHREVEEAINDSAVNINGDTFEAGAEYLFSNGSKFRQGAIDHGNGGGWARVCANEKADQWEDGWRYLISTTGSYNNVVYAETLNDIIPDDTYDETDSWRIGSRIRNLVTGIEYLCIKENEGDAIWVPSTGEYTPSASDEVDCALTCYNAVYSIQGDQLTIAGAFTLSPTSGGSLPISARLSLPFLIARFAGAYEGSGVLSLFEMTKITPGCVVPVDDSQLIEINAYAITGAATEARFMFKTKFAFTS